MFDFFFGYIYTITMIPLSTCITSTGIEFVLLIRKIFKMWRALHHKSGTVRWTTNAVHLFFIFHNRWNLILSLRRIGTICYLFLLHLNSVSFRTIYRFLKLVAIFTCIYELRLFFHNLINSSRFFNNSSTGWMHFMTKLNFGWSAFKYLIDILFFHFDFIRWLNFDLLIHWTCWISGNFDFKTFFNHSNVWSFVSVLLIQCTTFNWPLVNNRKIEIFSS